MATQRGLDCQSWILVGAEPAMTNGAISHHER